MEDNTGRLLYLFVAIIYWLLQKVGSRKKDKPTREEVLTPPSPTPAPEVAMDWTVDWAPWEEAAEDVPMAPAPTSMEDEEVPPPTPAPAATSSSLQRPAQGRILQRYRGWKKAIIMSELLRPVVH